MCYRDSAECTLGTQKPLSVILRDFHSWESTKVLQQGCPCAMLSVGLLPETSAYQLELAVYLGSRYPIAGIVGMHVCKQARMHVSMYA